MLDLNTITESVNKLAELKSDTIMNLQSMMPIMKDGKLKLITRRGAQLGMVQNGLSSYLGRIEVPVSFFKKCSPANKKGLLEQFHAENANQNVLVRKFNDNIRFIASSKYNCFDDTDLMKSLASMDSSMKIKEFHQAEGHTILRATVEKPIEIKGLRPFYPGIQVINSEIGNSSVQVQYFLWEEVCTNGMVAARGEFPLFRMRHIGKKDHGRITEAVDQRIQNMPRFAEMCEGSLNALTNISAQSMIARIKDDPEIPKAVQTAIPEYLKNYAENAEEATGLDVVSAVTESIQKYPWDTRLDLERTMGGYLLGAA